MVRKMSGVLGVYMLAMAGMVQAQGTYVFENVNVVPMDQERTLSNQTVVVQNGRITALGPSGRVQVPAGATPIDGRGKYLTPGLAEMHGHIPGQDQAFAERVLFMYVAGGATTVRGMQGHPNQLALRRRVEAREIIGPRLVLAGPQLSGNSAPDIATAERIVREQKSAGFDLLKIQEGLSADVYQAIVKTAREVNIPFAGHVPNAVGLQAALAARQATIDHLDNYIDALEADNSPLKSSTPMERAAQLPFHVDESKIPQLALATKQAGVAVVPTMPLWEVIKGLHAPESLLQRPELRYMPPQMVQNWSNTVANIRANTKPDAAAREVEIRNKMLKALSDAGVLILLGSDAPQLFSVPGFSLQNEMESYQKAGLSPFQILQTGTINVARYLNDEANSGTIAVGKRADLLLVDANPLRDVSNLARKSGVMVNGRWLTWSNIQSQLELRAGD